MENRGTRRRSLFQRWGAPWLQRSSEGVSPWSGTLVGSHFLDRGSLWKPGHGKVVLDGHGGQLRREPALGTIKAAISNASGSERDARARQSYRKELLGWGWSDCGEFHQEARH